MKDILIEGLLSKYNKLYGSLTEGYAHFEYASGGNPYIATTEKEKNRILRKYKGRVTEIKPGFYQIDDDPYMGADDGQYTYMGADDGYDTYTGEEGTYEGIDESCGKKSKKLKESMKEIDRKYFASLNKEEDGHYYILIDGTYEKDFYADSDEEAKKKFQQYLRKNESLKESKDSKDELYKKIVGYVKKYDSGELDIDETAKQILDFWKKSSEDNLNKDIDTAVKKTAHKKKNESLSLKEEKEPIEDIYELAGEVEYQLREAIQNIFDTYDTEIGWGDVEELVQTFVNDFVDVFVG